MPGRATWSYWTEDRRDGIYFVLEKNGIRQPESGPYTVKQANKIRERLAHEFEQTHMVL
ncbi:hypothetical protein J2S34_000695 [Nitrobacter winogradskyi]|uniref:Uncharacterized protein n=1 Tax=Nitrobacter winogradskyi TaxID=913 RepID=A0ACC6AFG5_NITWI|nr:hypothetical protein [Nitrobacter winogradskyi]